MLLMNFLGPEERLDSWRLLCIILSEHEHEAFQIQEKMLVLHVKIFI